MKRKNWVAKYPGQQPPRKITFTDVLKNIGALILMGLVVYGMGLMMVLL